MTNHEHHGHEYKGEPPCRESHADDHQKNAADSAGSLEGLPADKAALAELKNEILSGIIKEKRAAVSWGSVAVGVILALLTLVSVAQAVQSASLYNKLKSGDFQPAAAAAASGSASSLPSQVGGC